MDCTVNHTHDHLKSPCPCPQSVELGVPWLPIRFLNAANARNTCHLDCYPILSQRDSSHLNLCLCLQTCLFPKCCFWWIAVSEYHALCRELIKQREFFFFWPRFHLDWVCLCLLLLCISLFQMVPQMASIIIYTRTMTVFVLLFS